jgi:Asp-tRNA(Asn)/Glu-tRNA(Gln) amidotransferase A subunit family amidase
MHDLVALPASEMADLVRRRKLSPVEIVEAHLQRIEKVNPVLNAFVQVDSEGARKRAKEAESEVMRGDAIGQLHGVPISIKSSIDVAGLRCEAGSKLRAGHVAQTDAPLVRRLKEAGAIVLGNTNTPELLMAWETDNLLYGRTNNPWDLSRTAGGSSGGESAAIASGCSAGGIGSDGGGSIRVPAHFTGICGLKPTPGRVPATGHFPQSVGPFSSLGVVGPMARNVADLQLLFKVVAGPDDGDPSAAPVPLHFSRDEKLEKVRIGYFEDDGRTPVTLETRAAVRAAANALKDSGFEVVPCRPEGLEKARQLWWKFFGITGGMLLAPMLAAHENEISPILQEFCGWVAKEQPLSAQDLLDAWIERDLVCLEFRKQMQQMPIFISPVCSIPAFKHRERSWSVEGQTIKYLDAWSYTEFFNLLGNPCAVVPVNSSPEGLPIGIQIIGRPYEEETVLRIAARVEEKCAGWKMPPMLASLAAHC